MKHGNGGLRMGVLACSKEGPTLGPGVQREQCRLWHLASSIPNLKGTVSRDFLYSVFPAKQLLLVPLDFFLPNYIEPNFTF